MKILICFKVVPDWDKVLPADWDGFSPDTGLSYAGCLFNCFDESALEWALRLKDEAAARGELVFCAAATVAPSLNDTFCETLYAAGLDSVVLLQEPSTEFRPALVAERLAGYAREQGFDLVLAGTAAGMADTGFVPFVLGQRLGYPVLTDVQSISASESGVAVAQADEQGLWRREAELPLVVSVGNNPAVLRAVSLRARLAAKGRHPAALPPPGGASGACAAQGAPQLFRPKTGRVCRFLPAESAAAAILNMLQPASGPPPSDERNPKTPALPQDLKAIAYTSSTGNLPLTQSAVDAFVADWQARKPQLALLPDVPAGKQLLAALAEQENCACLPGAAITGFTPTGVVAEKPVCVSNLTWGQTLLYPAALTLAGPMPKNILTAPWPVLPQETPLAPTCQTLLEPAAPNTLASARLVLICGLGMGGKANCDAARALAARLGAAFGLTRPAALNGWGAMNEIVGQSGLSIRPEVCLVLGASGAAAFAAGIVGAKQVVAVNTNRDSLLFTQADMGVLADAPALVETLVALTSKPAQTEGPP